MQKLYTELSAYALELYMGQFSTPSTVVDSEGNESYTEDAQDKFNEIADDIEAILKKNGVSKSHNANAKFKAHLLNLGIAETRIEDLSNGLFILWSALCKLDYRNLELVCNEFEGLASACKKFGEIEDRQYEFFNSKGEEYK